MTATEAQPRAEVTPRRNVPESVDEKPEVADAKPANSDNRGLSLLGNSPQEQLDYIREMTRKAVADVLPESLRGFLIQGDSAPLGTHGDKRLDARRPSPGPSDGGREVTVEATAGRGLRESKPDPETARVERTRVQGTGTNRDTSVEIRYGKDDKPFFVRDHLGEWRSSDGGKTWQTDGPNFRTRRGEVGIDKQGNYTFENTDYGVKQTNSPDGRVTRTITNKDGETFSVTRDKKGIVTGFTDGTGEWTGDGKNWTNTKTNEKKSGTAALTDYGEFRFKPDKGDATVAQTQQLERIQKLQKEITDQYGVLFAKPGEKKDMVPPGVKIPESEKEPPAIAGAPTEAELETLKNVLQNTPHENYKNMKMWFIRPDENQNDALGFYAPSEKHQGCACHGNKGITKQNGDMLVLPMARQETKGVQGFEGTLYHELGHHEQYSRFAKSMMTGKFNDAESKKLMEDLGWQYSPRHKDHVLKDKTGGLWKLDQNPGNEGEPPTWRWVGGKAPKDGQRRLDSEEMRERALVKPITNYFDNPAENHAEALAMFRIGANNKPEGGRQYLAVDSPKLYEVTKNYDQKVINDKFGTRPDGQPKMVRDLDGRVVENTDAVRSRIAKQEYQWKLEALSQDLIIKPRRR